MAESIKNIKSVLIGHVPRGTVYKTSLGVSEVTLTFNNVTNFTFDLRGLPHNGYLLFGMEVTVDADGLDKLKVEIRPKSRNLADDAWVDPVNAAGYTTLEDDIDLETGAVGAQGLWSLNNHYTLVGTADIFMGFEALEFKVTSTGGSASGVVKPFIKAR